MNSRANRERERGATTRLVIRPLASAGQALDVTEAIVGTIAAELDRVLGGNRVLNLIEARMHIEAIMSRD